MAGGNRRGTNMPGRGANNKGDKDDANNSQFEFQYPSKLKPLFEEDGEDQEYDVPFKKPYELMNILNDLEEQNLKLI